MFLILFNTINFGISKQCVIFVVLSKTSSNNQLKIKYYEDNRKNN